MPPDRKVVARKSKNTRRKKEEKEIVKRVHEWVDVAVVRARENKPVFDVTHNKVRITADISGVSERSVYRFRTEKDGRKEGLGRPRIEFDDFDKLALSRLILAFYRRIPPELPTSDKIYTEACLIPGFPKASKTTVHRLIHKLGFVLLTILALQMGS